MVPYPVKVVKRGAELIHLLLADALGVPGQNLSFDFIDRPGNSCQQKLPANTDVLSSIQGNLSDEAASFEQNQIYSYTVEKFHILGLKYICST